MKLHENQLRLIWHLCRFSLLDYESCLHLLDTEETGDRVALSYAFRPLTKNKYLSRQKSGAVSVLKKGKALFPEEETLVSTGGGETMQRRVMQISRMALRMEEADTPLLWSIANMGYALLHPVDLLAADRAGPSFHDALRWNVDLDRHPSGCL